MKDIKVINNVVSYNSGHYARERLKYILMADRIGCTPDVITRIRDDLCKCVSNYVNIDSPNTTVQLSESFLIAKIPVKGIHMKKEKKKMKHFKQMDISTEKKYRLINYNFKLILFVIAAMIMGSITICSVRPDFLTKQLIGVSACIIGMIVVSLIDYDFICKYYMVLYVINIGLLLLVLVAGSGGGDTGVHRWFYISDSFTIQPSEFAKIILILCTAVFLEKIMKILTCQKYLQSLQYFWLFLLD